MNNSEAASQQADVLLIPSMNHTDRKQQSWRWTFLGLARTQACLAAMLLHLAKSGGTFPPHSAPPPALLSTTEVLQCL